VNEKEEETQKVEEEVGGVSGKKEREEPVQSHNMRITSSTQCAWLLHLTLLRSRGSHHTRVSERGEQVLPKGQPCGEHALSLLLHTQHPNNRHKAYAIMHARNGGQPHQHSFGYASTIT
jgi:hypothetical protein